MLTDEQLRRFGEDGYLVVPGVVPEDLLVSVDQEIDGLVAADPPPAGTVGGHGWFLPPTRLVAADAALRNSGALAVAAELVAPHALDHGLDHIQVGMNYPPWLHRPGGPHLDGHSPDQGNYSGPSVWGVTIHHFPRDFMYKLVWPMGTVSRSWNPRSGSCGARTLSCVRWSPS